MVVDDVPEGKTTSSRIDAPVKELPTGPRANGEPSGESLYRKI